MHFRNSSLACFLTLSVSLVASINVFPLVNSSRFDVGITSMQLMDQGRLDPFMPNNTIRSIMVSGFYPLVGCRNKQDKVYMPPATASFQDAKFAAYGLPNGSFESLFLQVCEDIPKSSSCRIAPFPVVLFSGALGTSRLIYNNMLQNIAAAGYYVISIDHPSDADIVEFPNGKIITAANISSDADIELALNTRVQDIAYVLSQLANSPLTNDLLPGYKHRRNSPAAVIGHSLGGAAAAESVLRVSSLRGGLNIDGTMFGSVVTEGLDRPLMLIGHENKTRLTDPSWEATWPKLRGWRKEFEVMGTAHYSFSDLPLMLSLLGIPDQVRLQPPVSTVLGTLEGDRIMEITVKYVTSFLNFILRSGPEGVLDGNSDEFPEVVEIE